jgi:hypothetical protein
MSGGRPSQASPAIEAHALPLIPFGPTRLSRLILGANPVNGGSHLSGFVNRQMKEYFTPETVMALLRRAGEVGINCWQSGAVNVQQWRQFRQETGSDMQFISLAADRPDDPMPVEKLAEAGVLGIAHHGEVTDTLLKQGQLDTVQDFLKRVRDLGVQVGVSTHMPAVIEYVEERGWDIDFYMACAYERHRTREELLALLGHVPIPLREAYLESDPPRMFEAVRQTPRPCLVFKILAAGRLCDKPEHVEEAFRSTFAGIKPNDAVIVGVFPKYSDQVGQNAELTLRYSDLSQANG